ncbi:hypothetical protein SO802_020232 [Lithocarpus litseifolius]|uniref:Uncharacterized protein n=1 Tax=Lithocarpus litseifolius TaxID=425828 RepID=A0AAW2CCJ3_9ROSI
MKKHISLCGAAIKKLKAKKSIWKAILCRRGVKGLVMVRRMKVLVSRFSAKRAYKGFDIDREVCLLIIHSYRLGLSPFRSHPFRIRSMLEYEVLRLANRNFLYIQFVLVDCPCDELTESIIEHEKIRVTTGSEMRLKLFARDENLHDRFPNEIAGGLCVNLLTCIVRAWDYNKPLFVASAMNTFMWNNPFME